MKSMQKSVLIWYSPAEMYALVTDVARYPQFLPWCDHSRVLESDEGGMVAELGISVGGLHQTFVTRNDHTTDQGVAMSLVSGPFSRLQGAWTFTPVGDADGPAAACRVSLSLNYGFDNKALQAVVGPVFDHIAASLVDAFVKRAEQVYKS